MMGTADQGWKVVYWLYDFGGHTSSCKSGARSADPLDLRGGDGGASIHGEDPRRAAATHGR